MLSLPRCKTAAGALTLFGLAATAMLVGCSAQKTSTVSPATTTADPAIPVSDDRPAASSEPTIAGCKANHSTRLTLRKPVTGQQLNELISLTQLEVLELYQSTFAPEQAGDLQNLARLTQLRLEDVAVDDEVAKKLATLTDLNVLNLPQARITDEGLSAIASGVPGLTLLRIGSPHITDVGIACLSNMRELRFLHLIDVPITDAGLLHLHAMHDLESLYIDGGSESDAGIRALLQANPRLHFHRNQLHIADDPRRDGH